MGKTNPTFRDTVRRMREDYWVQYRRALRIQHQERFDHLWDESELHSMAGSAYTRDAIDAVWMSMFLVQQRELDELRDRVDELEGAA